jgi:hypothetical protein
MTASSAACVGAGLGSSDGPSCRPSLQANASSRVALAVLERCLANAPALYLW